MTRKFIHSYMEPTIKFAIQNTGYRFNTLSGFSSIAPTYGE
jgi:hypothetical protein